MTDTRTVWRISELGDLCAMALRRSDHVFPRHVHETFSVGINLRGAHESRYRGCAHVLPPDAVAAVNPDEPHTGSRHGPGPWSFFGLYPNADVLGRLSREAGGDGRPYFRGPRVDDPDLVRRLAGVCRLLERGGAPLAVESELTRALADLVRRHAIDRPPSVGPGNERAGLERVRDYIHDHLADSPTLAELAGIAGLSRFHFLRVFRARFGFTPHAYLTQVRVARARELLAAGAPIARVAFAVGFADQSHLTNRFKQWVGVTPAEFRRAARV